MNKDISNSDDLIDSRDVIARIDDLRGDLDSLIDDVNNRQRDLDEPDLDGDDRTLEEIMAEAEEALAGAREELAAWLGVTVEYLPEDLSDLSAPLASTYASDDAKELAALEDLANQCDGCEDWKHGEVLIHEDYFQTYAEELASDVTDFGSRDVSWPFTCIDWAQAAKELLYDYTEVDFDGQTYYLHS